LQIKIFQNPFDEISALPEPAASAVPVRASTAVLSTAKPAPSLTEILAATSKGADRATAPASSAPAVGKYMPQTLPATAEAVPPPPKRPAVGREMNDFSGW
jgi:hypothetical protein